MKNVEFKMDVSIPLDSIEEVLITALEGGINYWGCLDGEDISVFQKWFDEKIEAGELKRDDSVHYGWMDAMFQGCPHKIAVYDIEDEEDEEPLGYLSMENIGKGLQLAMRDYPKTYAQHFPEYDSGDVISADVLFQLMVMGDVVYG
tara:strand:- start:10448 stop:10885 length:438 start_codon:yes stop_codon:yes gene_type:complete